MKRWLALVAAVVVLAFGAGSASAHTSHVTRASWNTDWNCVYQFDLYMGTDWVNDHWWTVLSYCDYSNGG